MPNAFGPQRATFSDDDGLWLAEYPMEVLFNILKDPVKWVAEAGDEPFKLLKPYMIHIYPTLPGPAGADAKILVQGIDKTNVITVQPFGPALADFKTKIAVASGGEQFEGWPEPAVVEAAATAMASTQRNLGDGFFATIHMDEAGEKGRAFIHFQVFRPDPSRDDATNLAQRHLTAAEFHLEAISTPNFFSDNLKSVLAQAPPAVLNGTPGGLQPAPDDPGLRVTANADGLLPVIILDTDSDPTGIACEILVANYNAGDRTYTLQQVYYKPYAS